MASIPRTRSASRKSMVSTGTDRATRGSNVSTISTSNPSRPEKRRLRSLGTPRGRKGVDSMSDSTELSAGLELLAKAEISTGSTSRASVASSSNGNDNGSDYSTPATSAFATPAPAAQLSKGKLPIRTFSPEPESSSRVSAIDRARRLRDSESAFTPLSQKRKREESDNDEDDPYDLSARLAAQLQQEEDAAAAAEIANNDLSDEPDYETPRSLRARKSRASYVVDSYEDEDSDADPLAGNGSIHSSDESNFTEEDDDEDDEMIEAVEKPSFKTSRPTKFHRSSLNHTGIIPSTSDSEMPDYASDNVSASIQRLRAMLPPASGLVHDSSDSSLSDLTSDDEEDDDDTSLAAATVSRVTRRRPARNRARNAMSRAERERQKLVHHHPVMDTMWEYLRNLPAIKSKKAGQPSTISRQLKPFQLEGLNWMQEMEKTEFGGGLLGDEMGMGKTIQAVSLIMSDYPAKNPSLVLVPPVALMQWQQEIGEYTDGTLKTLVLHGTNVKAKNLTVKDLRQIDVVLMSYNSLESMYRHQEKGFKRKDGLSKQKSLIHQIQFHRVILDEAHCIKQRTTGVAKACFALKADHKWCLSGTPLQNRIGEFFSLLRFLDIRPFACYFCKQCKCEEIEWSMNQHGKCNSCGHSAMHHASVFNQELLNPIQKFGNKGEGKEAFAKLRILTDKIMLRRIKRNHSSAMELPAKEIYVDRYFFGEEENDFAASIMNNSSRKFETYVAQGVMLNNYANIFGLIMQMRQVADHPDLILKKNSEGGQNIIVCSICDNTAEDAIRSVCKHDFCRECVKAYIASEEARDENARCPQCHITLSIDLEQPEVEQDQELIKKTSIINRIKMENWTSSSKIEALLHDLHELRSRNSSSKSIIFSQFTSMLQLIEWRLRRAGMTTVMLDGSMTPAQRQASINHFKTNVDVECFLVSLKAGGVALNLTEASKVFIVDPWWNPAAEWQSADRCHRIGQSRPCTITRLCIEDSVESRIVLLQEKKANMINSTINNDETAMESLTPEDMEFLFRGS